MAQALERLEVESVRDAENAQRDSMPREDLRRFAGEWVALRKGKVVGHDEDLGRLRRRDGARPDDVLIPVPRTEDTYRI
jgi:Family of unknown function (DUF5678)